MIESMPGGVRILLHVQPGAKQTALAGVHGDAIKLRLASPPVEGKANAALRSFLARQCGVPLAAVTLVRGAASRGKTVTVDGITVAEARARLLRDASVS